MFNITVDLKEVEKNVVILWKTEKLHFAYGELNRILLNNLFVAELLKDFIFKKSVNLED